MRLMLLRRSALAILLLIGFSGESEATDRLRDFLVIADSNDAMNPESPAFRELKDSFANLDKSDEARSVLSLASSDDLKSLTSTLANLVLLADVDRVSHWLTANVKELHARGVASRKDYEYAYNALVSDRKFDEARKFRREFSSQNLREVPEADFITDEDAHAKPMFWEVGSDGRILTQRAFEFTGPQLIVVAHPAVCQPSRRAAEWIYSDPELRSKLARRGLFLVPAFWGLHFDYVREWNKAHPGNDLVIAHSKKSWPMLDLRTTPGFYFFQDGKLIEHFEGWPPEGNLEALIAGLAAIGL